ncbi:octaprenyl-diphosphate synthase [Limibacillus halophilus]|uniref:Octaprenyl diphosphate synthase n=1 Tax=Limibacillus halophilus TaxID=1579333 RepID=A0A839SZ79_9PROT|nr:octaprenyl-diphosphate synthase [Limibacillus halophilus]
MPLVADATEKTGQTANGEPLGDLRRLVEPDLKKVNATILERMQSPVALIPQLAGHIIAAGGKRLRPILTLAAARLCGYEGERHIGLAACVEFIHTATLLHDDVVDDSHLRRGLETANAVWGNKASVLVGDFLFSRAFQIMVADGSLKVLKILSDASAEIAEGEVGQLLTANNTATDETAYMDVICAKTAVLFAAAAQVGGVVADEPEERELALRSFGMNLGIAFQLVDDVLDYSAEQAALGKTVGDDFREGKITLPIVLAFAQGDEAEKAFWRRCLEDLEQTDQDITEAIRLMRKYRALDEAMDRARSYADKARQALAPFPDRPEKTALLDLAEFTVARRF